MQPFIEDPSQRTQLVPLISGGDSTALKVLEATHTGELYGLYTVPGVIASREDAPGIQKALKAGLHASRVRVLPPPPRPVVHGLTSQAVEEAKGRYAEAQSTYGRALLQALADMGAQVVAQLGWLPITPREVVETFEGRMLNQHPGPIRPGQLDFGGWGMFGKRVHAARLLFARRCDRPEALFTEATVQFVGLEPDSGAVFHRRRLDILPEDDVDSLQQKLLPIEHEAVLKGLVMLATGEAVPLTDNEPVVHDYEADLLRECKRAACLLYRNG
jgi:phosphoribosylglycinamide formyltransferase-1